MCGYRLYILNEKGHIRSAMELECEDDAHAIHLAETSLSAPMELWQGTRLVRKFAPPAARRAAH
jgi:hypothetical protein